MVAAVQELSFTPHASYEVVPHPFPSFGKGQERRRAGFVLVLIRVDSYESVVTIAGLATRNWP